MYNTGLFIIRAQEAADILNVSVDYVRKLSRENKLAFHGHPDYFRLDVVLDYKERQDEYSDKALLELVRLTEEYGGYKNT